ncbi:MAG: hypothetical protein ABFS46_08145 [Myxococcota bacterium]
MASTPFHVFDPLFSDEQAEAMVDLCQSFGGYGMYSEEGTADDWDTGLPQRFDAAFNFVATGGRFAREEPVHVLAARTNYFRETYAYRDEIHAPEIEPFHHFEGFLEAARKVHGGSIVQPAISYANLLVPGQELAVHTDVPEFRGMSRMDSPQWLLVVMHHSGLFDPWRMRIATAISYFGECGGGALAFYPDGREAPPKTLEARHNTAILLDTDTVFHGVDRVSEVRVPIAELRPGMRLVYEKEGSWRVGPPEKPIARYQADDVRFSVSWKAYCYADAAEEHTVLQHTDDLEREGVLERLFSDLRARGRLGDEMPERRELALMLVDEYVKFPPAAPAAGA